LVPKPSREYGVEFRRPTTSESLVFAGSSSAAASKEGIVFDMLVLD